MTFRAPFAPAGEPPAELQNTKVDGGHFRAQSWSPDGTKLAGHVVRESGRDFGVALYDLDARTVTVLSSDDANVVRFMADSRRVMYFDNNGTEFVVVDTMTRARTVVDVRLPGPASGNGFALSPDNRTIYYGAMRAESDIWIVERR